MKKMKKLNLNKVQIVSLKNVHSIHGGTENCNPQTHDTTFVVCEIGTSVGIGTCQSTGITYGGNDGGTLKSADTPSVTCSQIITGCEIEG